MNTAELNRRAAAYQAIARLLEALDAVSEHAVIKLEAGSIQIKDMGILISPVPGMPWSFLAKEQQAGIVYVPEGQVLHETYHGEDDEL